MAAESFHDSYAKSRGLTKSKDQLGKLTPLLSHGADQRTDVMFSGTLREGFEGSLALFTSTDRHLDDQRNETRKDNPSTVVLIEVADSPERLPDLIAHRRSGARALDSVKDRFRSEYQRVNLESEALADQFEIFVGRDQDPNFVRQLFSPSFIV